jgi:hypothetical protein
VKLRTRQCASRRLKNNEQDSRTIAQSGQRCFFSQGVDMIDGLERRTSTSLAENPADTIKAKADSSPPPSPTREPAKGALAELGGFKNPAAPASNAAPRRLGSLPSTEPVKAAPIHAEQTPEKRLLSEQYDAQFSEFKQLPQREQIENLISRPYSFGNLVSAKNPIYKIGGLADGTSATARGGAMQEMIELIGTLPEDHQLEMLSHCLNVIAQIEEPAQFAEAMGSAKSLMDKHLVHERFGFANRVDRYDNKLAREALSDAGNKEFAQASPDRDAAVDARMKSYAADLRGELPSVNPVKVLLDLSKQPLELRSQRYDEAFSVFRQLPLRDQIAMTTTYKWQMSIYDRAVNTIDLIAVLPDGPDSSRAQTLHKMLGLIGELPEERHLELLTRCLNVIGQLGDTAQFDGAMSSARAMMAKRPVSERYQFAQAVGSFENMKARRELIGTGDKQYNIHPSDKDAGVDMRMIGHALEMLEELPDVPAEKHRFSGKVGLLLSMAGANRSSFRDQEDQLPAFLLIDQKFKTLPENNDPDIRKRFASYDPRPDPNAPKPLRQQDDLWGRRG